MGRLIARRHNVSSSFFPSHHSLFFPLVLCDSRTKKSLFLSLFCSLLRACTDSLLQTTAAVNREDALRFFLSILFSFVIGSW